LATSGPISLYTAPDAVKGVQKSLANPPVATATANPTAAPDKNGVPGSQNAAGQQHQPLPTAAIPGNPSTAFNATIPTPSMADVFNFDITIDWVMRQWPRVSTGLAHMQMQGYRVPLVTGTAPTDLAGSLTYYFNSRQQVQRITFHGTTGDASALAALLTNRYHFVRRLTNNPGLIIYESVDANNQMSGLAKIRTVSVIKADQPFNHFDVDLTLLRQQE
jgi:hypothetical protein